MSRTKFLKALRKEAARRGLSFDVDKKKGKGSHYLVRAGKRKATVPSHLSPQLEKRIRKQLGLID